MCLFRKQFDSMTIYKTIAISSTLESITPSQFLTRFIVPVMGPSCGARLRSNQKVIGYHHNSHATIALLSHLAREVVIVAYDDFD